MLKEFNTGEKYPTDATDLLDRGHPWDTPSNCLVKDGVDAFVNLTSGEVGNTLRTFGFGFNLPGDAVITGIVARGFVIYPVPSTLSFRLWGGGDYISHYIVAGCGMDSEDVWITVGDANNVWGSSLTPAIVNAPDFGCTVYFGNESGDLDHFRIDVVGLTIYYIAETGVDEYMQTADMERMESELRSLLNDPDGGDYTQEELYSCLEGAYRETMLAARSRIARVSYPSAGGIAHVRDAPTEAGEDYVEGDLLAVVDGAATGGQVEIVEVNSDGAVLRVRAVTGTPLGTIGASAGSAYTTGTKTTTGGTGTGCTVYVDRLGAYLTAGVDVYEFPPIHEFIAIFLDGVMLHHKSLEHIYRAEHRESDATYTCWDEASPGTPTEWAFNKGSCIRVWPVPDAGGVLEAIGYAVDEDAEVERSVDRLTYLPPALMPACLDRAEARARRRRPTHPGNLTMAQMLTVDWRTACAEVGRSNKE